MAYLDELKSFSFGGMLLPYQRMQVRSVYREYVHEYPHVSGGALEKLGRRLIEIRVTSQFDESIGRNGGRYAGRNLMSDLGTLQQWHEGGETKPIYIPNIGEINAMMFELSRELNVETRSGEAVEMAFREDMGEDFLVETRLQFAGGVTATLLADLEALSPAPIPSIFQQIAEAVNSLIAFRDTAQMWVGFVAAKIEGLRGLFIEADDTLDLLNDPENNAILEALKALWESVEDFAESALGATEFATYTTPKEMSAAEASEAIYGDTTHAIDIANLNAIGDMYHIPAGAALSYIVGA